MGKPLASGGADDAPSRMRRLAEPSRKDAAMTSRTKQESKSMKRRVRRIVVGGSMAVAAFGIGVGPASAYIQRSSGCVEWNSTDGCVVTQSCSVDSDSRRWSCLTWDTRTQTLTGTGGTY